MHSAAHNRARTDSHAFAHQGETSVAFAVFLIERHTVVFSKFALTPLRGWESLISRTKSPSLGWAVTDAE